MLGYVTDGPDTLLTTREAAKLCNVTPAAIRKWAQLGKLEPSGISPAGAKLYRWRDVAACEKRTRIRSGRAHRMATR